MPNYIRTVIKFKNLTKDDVNFILDTIATPTDEGYIIDFDKIIPEPQDESECPEEFKVNKDSHISPDKDKPWFDWYRWHITHWGTKWGAYDCYTKVGKSYIQFVFSTAWSPAIPIIHRLALLHFDIEVKYADEAIGSNCGKLYYSAKEDEWTETLEEDLHDPERFARYVWENY